MSRAVAATLVVFAACKDAPPPPPPPPPPPTHVVRVPERVASADAAAMARSCPNGLLVLTDARREPQALVSEGRGVYWVDDGEFVESPALRFIHDGALWHMETPVSTARPAYEGLGVAHALALAGENVLVAELSAGDGAHPGVVVIPRAGGMATWRWDGTPVKTLVASGDDVFAVQSTRMESTWRVPDGRAATLVDERVGYVEQLAVTGDSLLVAGATDGNAVRGGVVTVIDRTSGRERWRIEIPRVVTSVAADGDAVLLAAGAQLLRVDAHGGVSVLGVAPDTVENLVVRGRTVFWLASEAKAGFSIRATPLDGGPTLQILRRDGVFSHRFTVGEQDLWWVESDPVTSPWSNERAQYRVGNAKLTLC